MNRLQLLLENSKRLRTRMGAAFVGQRAVFRGHDLHADLKDMDWLELYVFGITGRRYNAAQLKLLHALWAFTSYPDARIWNNRVAALAGSARSTGALGLAAALAVSEAKIYGLGPCLGAYDFFSSAAKALNDGTALTDVVHLALQENRGIGGYGRPIAAQDERIGPITALATELGLANGFHITLAFETDALLRAKHRRLQMNYAAVTAAFLLDLGFTRNEYYLFMFPVFLAGMPPCFIESAERPEQTLFPIACENLRYEGVGKRSWTASKNTDKP